MAVHFAKLCNVCLALLCLSCFLTSLENAAEAQESYPPPFVGNPGHSTDDQFKTKFLTLENHLKIVEALPGAMTKAKVETLQSRLDVVRKEYQVRHDYNENNDVPESYRYNSERLRILFERLDVFVDRVQN